MSTSIQQRRVSNSEVYRWLACASGALLFIAWLGFVIFEAISNWPPSRDAMYQAVGFAIVFAGYALGWRFELAGGLLAILGTAAVFAACAFTGLLPQLSVAWFAAPGVLYLLAWHYDHRHGERPTGQP